jgi:2-methylisocitrate lyase-like PEP mutase family enzyme
MATMATPQEKAATFLTLHRGSSPLLIPNPWDIGSARILAHLGFAALATTSGGFAGSQGRPDGSVTREEAIAHARSIAEAVDIPVSADLENCFADDPEGAARTVSMAVEAGLAGCSIEDYTRNSDSPIYELAGAKDRVAAAAEAAHATNHHLVLTARAENYIRGNPDLSDTITRLQAYQEAGADVLYAPLVKSIGDIRTLVKSVDRPVNVLAGPGVPPVEQLAEAGVARISVGSAFAAVAWGALAEAAVELQNSGTYRFWDLATEGSQVARAAFRAAP